MTIQMRAQWNGFEAGQVVSTLSGSEETRLIGLGLARSYTAGMDGYTPTFSAAEKIAGKGLVSAHGIAGGAGKRGVAQVGQSNERSGARNWAGPGSVATDVTFDGLGLADPIAPSVSALGSVIPHLHARLRNRGWSLQWRNCAVGGSSFIKQWAGQATQWAANAAFFGQRASLGTGDAGDYGDVIVDSGRVFRCKVGRPRYATNASGVAIPSGSGATNIDYIITPTATQVTGATKPAAFATAAVNDDIVDNTITWTCVATSVGSMAAFKVLRSGDFGFDPLGLLARTKTNLDAISGVSERWVFMANGQSDAQASLANQPTIRSWYKQAVESMVDYFVAQGYRVALGFTCFSPNYTVFADPTYPDQFATLQLAINDALTVTYAGNASVIAGGDLYDYWGRTPPTYPEPPATSIVGANAPHLLASAYPEYAQVWADALAASGKW
ncbi:hypothetical protein [Aquabacterium sp. OR-4]|uniref:hypothetical protein n=1 Tax=Aquabacterium sp. OR-4 TaxID=2978127 RepID=UPI0028C6643F|nr:hypothetical protein [Aquabacterium sp. OR-4]MDT7836463.1 hypothetical protein [Aquabacterium sp. OR-4]